MNFDRPRSSSFRMQRSSMMHSLKKNAAKATAAPRGINPGGEFLDYKNRLTNMKKNLVFVDKKMEEALRAWRVLIIEQRKFAQRLHEGYPIADDDIEGHARDFADGAQKLYNYFLRERNTDTAPFERLHQQVKHYLNEIDSVESMYPELVLAKSEAERYQAKLDAMDRKGRGSDIRRSRNVQKLDSEKDRADTIRRQVITAQKNTYGKAGTVYKAAICSYWWTHERHTQVLLQMMEKTSQFAAETGEELMKIDISQLAMGSDTAEESWESPSADNFGSTDPATEADTIEPLQTRDSTNLPQVETAPLPSSRPNKSSTPAQEAGSMTPQPAPWPVPSKNKDELEEKIAIAA